MAHLHVSSRHGRGAGDFREIDVHFMRRIFGIGAADFVDLSARQIHSEFLGAVHGLVGHKVALDALQRGADFSFAAIPGLRFGGETRLSGLHQLVVLQVIAERHLQEEKEGRTREREKKKRDEKTNLVAEQHCQRALLVLTRDAGRFNDGSRCFRRMSGSMLK